MESAIDDVRRRQKGAALLLVLWTALLLSVVLAGVVAAARIEAKILVARKQRLEADLAIDAAFDLASRKIATGEIERGKPYVENFELNGLTVTVDRSIEGEMLDLNRTDEAIFAQVFRSIELPDGEADRLAAEIADWRDEDSDPRPNGAEKADYAAARSKFVGDRPFRSISEGQNVLHMTPAIFEQIEPILTVFGVGGAPTPRVMALIGKPQLESKGPVGAPRLGAATAAPPSGSVATLEAIAATSEGKSTIRKRLRVIRVTSTTDSAAEILVDFSSSERS